MVLLGEREQDYMCMFSLPCFLRIELFLYYINCVISQVNFNILSPIVLDISVIVPWSGFTLVFILIKV